MEDAFRELHGRTLNFNSMVQAVGKLNKWYEEKGVLGQVRIGAAQGSAVISTDVCSAVQCSAVQCSAVQCSANQRSAMLQQC